MERELWSYLKTAPKPIVLYGMGNGADKIIAVLNELGIEFKGVFASDAFVRDKYFHGHKVSSYAQLKEKFGDMIVLLCFGSAREEVLENVKRIAAEQELYAPEVPVIGGGLFTERYLFENKEQFKLVYNQLADELSRKTFENTVLFKLSGKINYLFDCEVEENEPYNSFFRLGDNESFLDLGAYNGDTVLDFINRVGKYQNIVAVEPDKKTFKKLVNNTQKIPNIRCENKVISSFCGISDFGMRSGRGSGVSNGNDKAEFITVDGLLSGERVSYIKMDIEGEEARAIEGARQSIEGYSPKMLIACYHRTEDLIAIPRAVFEIKRDYKLYMRHFKSLPAWDTNYYFC